MKSIKIAIIEDDQAIVRMYTTKFEMSGHTVLCAPDGIQGLELVKQSKPDVILLDLMMPKMSGIETLRELREQPGGDNYKIIVLTNMKDDDTVSKINELRADDYIVKAELSPTAVEEHILKLLGLPIELASA